MVLEDEVLAAAKIQLAVRAHQARAKVVHEHVMQTAVAAMRARCGSNSGFLVEVVRLQRQLRVLLTRARARRAAAAHEKRRAMEEEERQKREERERLRAEREALRVAARQSLQKVPHAAADGGAREGGEGSVEVQQQQNAGCDAGLGEGGGEAVDRSFMPSPNMSPIPSPEAEDGPEEAPAAQAERRVQWQVSEAVAPVTLPAAQEYPQWLSPTALLMQQRASKAQVCLANVCPLSLSLSRGHTRRHLDTTFGPCRVFSPARSH